MTNALTNGDLTGPQKTALGSTAAESAKSRQRSKYEIRTLNN